MQFRSASEQLPKLIQSRELLTDYIAIANNIAYIVAITTIPIFARISRSSDRCITTAIWRCHKNFSQWQLHKNFSQWQRSFQCKLCPHLLKLLRLLRVAVVIEGPGCWRDDRAPRSWIWECPWNVIYAPSGINQLVNSLYNDGSYWCASRPRPRYTGVAPQTFTLWYKWRFWRKKQVSHAGISNYILQFTVGCNPLYLP